MPVGLGDLLIWVFHGDKDRSIDVSSSERMVGSGNRVKLTIYSDTAMMPGQKPTIIPTSINGCSSKGAR